MSHNQGIIALIWVWMAILSGGYARTRGRSAWAWFVWTLVFGPFAAFLLVTWPAVPPKATEAFEKAGGEQR